MYLLTLLQLQPTKDVPFNLFTILGHQECGHQPLPHPAYKSIDCSYRIHFVMYYYNKMLMGFILYMIHENIYLYKQK